jgi:CHAT domain-containing protein
MKKLIAICLLLSFFSGSAQPKYDKLYAKAEASYAQGDYKAAFKALEKFRKKVNGKLGAQNKYTPSYWLSMAKYSLASGLPLDFENHARTAMTAAKDVQPDTKEQAAILIALADLYNQNSSYKRAIEILEQARPILALPTSKDELLSARWDVTYAEALTGQGYFNKSANLLNERAVYFAGRAIRQETFVDEKGNLKSRKLTDEEFNKRASDYARLLTLLGRTYGEQGELQKADSTFVMAASWLRKNMNRFAIEYIANQFYNASLLIENGNERLPDEMDLSKLLMNLKSNYKPTHYLATQMYETLIRMLLRDGSSSYFNVKLEYEKLINRGFALQSVYPVRLKAIEFDSKVSRDKTRNLESSASSLLTQFKGLPKYNLIAANLNDFLSDFSIREKNFTGAETYFKNIIEIKENLFGVDAPETHLARIKLANYYLDYTNNIQEAEKIYENSFRKVVAKEIGAWHKDHLVILNHLAMLYELTDKYTEASNTLDKATLVARSKYSDTDYEYGVELNNISRLQIKLGEYEKADENIKRSLKILEEFRKDEEKKQYLIAAIETEAVLFGIKGLFDEAEDALSRSAKMILKAENIVGLDELATAREMASLFIQLGRYSETEDMLKELIKQSEKQFGPNSLRLIDPLVNLGRLTLLKGDYTEADKIAKRANEIAVKVYGQVSTKTAPTQKLLSDIDYQIGDYEKAEENIVLALKSQEKQFGRNHIDVAKSLSQLGLIKFYKGENRKEVESIMMESRDIVGNRLGKENPQYAEILKNVALVYLTEKRYDIAFSSLTQAEAIWKAKTGRKNNINTASIYSLTGDVFYQQKNYNKADEFYDQAKNLYEKFFSRSHPEYVKILSKQAKVAYMKKDFKRSKRNIEEALGNYEAFIKQFFPALSEREKAKYWNTIKGDFEFYNTLAFSQLEDFRDLSGKVYNYQLLTKALLLSSSIKIRERILNSQDETLKELYGSWLQKKEFLTNALSMSTQQLEDNGINTSSLTAEVENLERELSERSELFGQGFENKRITYENVQKSIDKADAAIEIVRYRYFNHTFSDSIIYVALFVRNDNARPKVITIPGGHDMETRYFKYYRNCITGNIPDAFSYKVFWEPIQKGIGQYSTLYLSPDGVYNQINLEAIPTPDGKYVIDNSNIVMVSNTKDLYFKKQKAKQAGSTGAPSNTATMFGNPTFYLSASVGNVPPLPGTKEEVKQLQDLLSQKGWKTTEYVETAASEERVKELESPKIFHIATHGFYTAEVEPGEGVELTENEAMLSQNPLMKTGLLLKGGGDILLNTKYNYNIESGILTAYEAMNLNLDKTDLVVLSACETGLGEIANGEGVYGLQRAFLVAGAKVLIMSMFKVDDDATQKLVLSFYRKWLATGNLRQSFAEAKKELRVEYPDPIHWGAFMMIGLD